MIKISCAICKQRSQLRILFPANFKEGDFNKKIFSARRTVDNIHYQINKCEKCGLIFSSPILDQRRIENLYRESRFNYEDQASFLKETYYQYLLSSLRKFSKSCRILDIGCGNGFFLEKLYEMGFCNVYGIEPSQDAVSKAPPYLRGRIKKDILKDNLFPNHFFDVITCFQTLDHVANPNFFLKSINKLLKSQGAIFFVVHNTDGLSVKIFGEKSPIFDIEHIFLFNKENLAKIFQKNNFYKIKVFDITNKYPFLYWFSMLPMPKTLKMPVVNFLKATRIGEVPISLKAGNIGIIAHKKG